MKQPTGVGVGRPIDERWMVGFRKSFKETAPRGMKFFSRRLPGLLYVSGEEVGAFVSEVQPVRMPESRLRKKVRSYIGELALGADATKPLKVEALSLERHNKRQHKRYTELALWINDPNEGVTMHERDIVRNAFYRGPRHGDNRYRLLLGTINRPPAAVTYGFLQDLFAALKPSVKLDPVGLVLR